jgi:hypothetical protein
VTAQYAPTVLQTISNPDGTVSIIQVDPSNPIITLPDGTTAQVQGVATVSIQVLIVILLISLDNRGLRSMFAQNRLVSELVQCLVSEL